MAELLTDEQITQRLAALPEWHRDGDDLVRTAELGDFTRAVEAVNRVAAVAERANHHPDIDIRWATLTFRCSTHYLGGITDADFTLAGDIDAVLAEFAG